MRITRERAASMSSSALRALCSCFPVLRVTVGLIKPYAIAIEATEALGRLHSLRTRALRSAPCRRHQSVLNSMVSTCYFGGHHRRPTTFLVQGDLAGRTRTAHRVNRHLITHKHLFNRNRFRRSIGQQQRQIAGVHVAATDKKATLLGYAQRAFIQILSTGCSAPTQAKRGRSQQQNGGYFSPCRLCYEAVEIAIIAPVSGPGSDIRCSLKNPSVRSWASRADGAS